MALLKRKGDVTSSKVSVKDVRKGATILIDGMQIRVTGRRFVAGKNMIERHRANNYPPGYYLDTEEHGEVYVEGTGYLEVVNV